MIHIVPDELLERRIALCGVRAPKYHHDPQPMMATCPDCKRMAKEIGYRPRLDAGARQILELLAPFKRPKTPHDRGREIAEIIRSRNGRQIADILRKRSPD